MTIQFVLPGKEPERLLEKKDTLVGDSGTIVEKNNGVYKFAAADNYTNNFGYQWNRFDKTQLDGHHSTVNQSKKRFFTVTGWQENGLQNQNILEVGSGSERFSRVILQNTKATLYSVDYSNAVEANYKNNGPNDRFYIFQASIYELPFAPAQFDKVVCFGVLQHTPDFEHSIKCLADMVKPGGELVVDFYPIRGWWTKIHAKYIFRFWTKKLNHEKLLSLIESNVDWLIKTYQILYKIGLHIFTRFLPICDIKKTLPAGLNKLQLKEWVILDTFDMFSPEYDNPQRMNKVIKWFSNNGLTAVEGKVKRFENNQVTVVRGIK